MNSNTIGAGSRQLVASKAQQNLSLANPCDLQDRTYRYALLLLSLFLSIMQGCVVKEALSVPSVPASQTHTAIVVQNFYYALPGKADEVLRWRLHASEVRARLGLAEGRVLRRLEAPREAAENDDEPDVIWECEYPSAEARAADIARLDASHEFEPVEAHMQTLIRRFRRVIMTIAKP